MGHLRFLAGLCAALAAQAALGCGHCIEDQVAAAYDYNVELRAGRDGLRIAYLGIRGGRAESAESAAVVAGAIGEIPAVSTGTVRVSRSPAAASFAWNDHDAGLETILQGINRRLAPRNLRLELLRVWDAQTGLH